MFLQKKEYLDYQDCYWLKNINKVIIEIAEMKFVNIE